MLTCLVSVNAKSIVEYDYDYVDIWFNQLTAELNFVTLSTAELIFAIMTFFDSFNFSLENNKHYLFSQLNVILFFS